MNDAGQAAFIATLTGVGINSTNDLAMFSGAPGALQLVAREGALAPGPNRIYTDFFTVPGLNASGEVFGDKLDDNSFPYFIGLPGALGLFAQEGI